MGEYEQPKLKLIVRQRADGTPAEGPYGADLINMDTGRKIACRDLRVDFPMKGKPVVRVELFLAAVEVQTVGVFLATVKDGDQYRVTTTPE